MMWWYGNGMGAWGYTLMTVSMLVFWGLVVFGVVALVRHLGRQDRSVTAGQPSPEQVLATRFVHGQIDEQEYRERLDVLRGEPRALAKP